MNTDVSVREVMDREYVGVSESDDLVDTVELLLRQQVETAVVQRGSEHVGVLTQEDVLATLVEGPDPQEATVGDVMSESVPTVSPDARLDAAADMMSTQESSRLVVTNGSEPMGVITERDLLSTRSHGLELSSEQHEGEALLAGTGNRSEPREASQEPEVYSDQSICEGCGKFVSDLSVFNGQLLCADCRAM